MSLFQSAETLRVSDFFGGIQIHDTHQVFEQVAMFENQEDTMTRKELKMKTCFNMG
jgi:hypothetical protein